MTQYTTLTQDAPFYTLTLQIEEGSAADLNIRAVAERDGCSLEDAALKVMNSLLPARPPKASPAALAILGAFSAPEDVALMDEVMELIRSDKERQNAEPLRV